MKKTIYLMLLCLIAMASKAQQKTRITGKFINCQDKVLELAPSTGDFKDSILVNADGSFSYETTKITEPFRANLTNRKQIQVQLFLAPGYNLQLNADVKDYQTAKSTLAYTGIGAKTNSYWQEGIGKTKPDTVNWNKKDADTYLAHQLSFVNDHTVIDKIFDASNHEPYADYFRQSLLLDKKFGPLIGLFSSYAYVNKLPWKQLQKMAKRLGFKNLEKELNNEANLSSSAFSYFVSEYPFYCNEYHAFPADSTQKQQGNYTLYLTAKLLKGKVYDYVASQTLQRNMSSVYKLDDIYKLSPYIAKINDRGLKQKLKDVEADRVKTAMGLQAGNVSPVFNLPDTSGTLYQLESFKGKVVYIDLWASWCGPCKEETPFLKKIYDQYKGNDKLQVISIAAFDAKNRKFRYDIIKKDGMDWLQLEDTNDAFAKAYQANFIPRFIIIDKEGRIVDSDAVRPSEPEKLTAILNREINK
ncbi:TlpA disulfide reductase family protein [Pedobacter sp. KR3-3]|uniref:TlpA disulfide reductase family protein n=1 Tax=Pedobacter albus TaxID=3113905 RepID=A0ABU7I7A7_9SPHI|nr:TlpA disulfide reductase family protein [Pedobacter sp. KR3-3]MEE1945359.1 TlpA disulfide reductase family protein [Pedobacter sp. KR3-3]